MDLTDLTRDELLELIPKLLAEREASLSELEQNFTRQRTHLDLLARASGELTECCDLDATMKALARVARDLVQGVATFCSVHVPHGSGLRLIAYASERQGTSPPHSLELAMRSASGLIAKSLTARRSKILDVATLPATPMCEGDARLHELACALSLGAVLLIPMVARARLLGLWCIGVGREHAREHAAHVACFEEIALRCAFALDNAHLFGDLAAAVQSRDNLLAIVSHDLRNPLNAIALTARSLTPSPETKERRSSKYQVELISRSVGHMNHLLDDLLIASTLESGRLTVELRAEDPVALLREVLQTSEPIVRAKTIRIELSCPRELAPIAADWHRLRQVFANLIGNAVKFTPKGGLIQIGALAQASLMKFWVSDNGTGIPMHELGNVFDRYWTRDVHARGVGLGLFICRGLVEAHGGLINVESRVGEGSTFTFTIPTVEMRNHV